MKSLIFLSIVILLLTCKNQDDKGKKDLKPTIGAIQYNKERFDKELFIDTTGCWWIIKGRKIMDTLIYEKAFIQIYEDTFLATSKYKRLWTCNIPSFALKANDTILITGDVYPLYAADYGRGIPIIITKINYSDKKK